VRVLGGLGVIDAPFVTTPPATVIVATGAELELRQSTTWDDGAISGRGIRQIGDARAVGSTQIATSYYDFDGDVDFGDYMILEAAFGGPGEWTGGDFDFDGDIDFGDYMILEASFGDTVPTTAAMNIPEPSTLVMLLGGVVALGWWRRRW